MEHLINSNQNLNRSQILDTHIDLSNLNHEPLPNLEANLKINYQQLATELVRQLRGEKSQRQLSEELGYSFNQVGKWESGVTQIKWDDFLKVADCLNIPMEKHFRYSFWMLDPEFCTQSTLTTLDLNLSANVKSANDQILLKKWLTGSTIPDLAEVLKAIGTKSPLLFGWLSLFVNCQNLESLKEPYNTFLVNIDAIAYNPIVVYLNAALQLKAYQDLEFHDDAILAEHSACTIQDLKKALKSLLHYGLIKFDGKKYHPCSFDFSFGGLRHPRLRSLTKHTTELVARRYSETPAVIDPNKVKNSCQASVRVTALSSEASKKIVSLITKFHTDVGEVCSQDTGIKENVQIILIHSLTTNINAHLDPAMNVQPE